MSMAKKPKQSETAPKDEAPTKKSGQSAVQAWAAKINSSQRFKGVVQVRAASEVQTPYNLRRPTGIMSLDLALAGGLHAGGPIEVHGAESAGKTHLVFRVAGGVQQHYKERAAILIFNTEIRLDKGFARRSGFCVAYSHEEIKELDLLRQARGMPPFTKEEHDDLRMQIGDVIIISAATADHGLQAALDGLESNLFQLFIIESLGAFLTPEAAEGDVGDAHYGGSSRVLTDFQNKVYPLFMMDRPDGTMNETTIIGINQARAVIGGSPRGPKTKAAAGAYSWKHGQLASIELSRGADIRESDRGPVIGKEVNWKLTKGKVGTHDGKRGEYNYFHVPRTQPVFWSEASANTDGFGVDVYTDLMEAAIQLGVAQANGAWFTLLGKRFQGKEKLADAIATDPILAGETREHCMRASGLLVRYM